MQLAAIEQEARGSAPDLKAIHADILRGSRFLGIPQVVWGAAIGSVVFALLLLVASLPAWIWPACTAAAWGIVELSFLPRRLEAKRLARYVHRQEVTRIAIARGVSLSEVC